MGIDTLAMTWSNRNAARGAAAAVLSLLLCGFYPGARGQSAPMPEAKQLAKEAAENEVNLIVYDRTYLRYRVHTRDAKGDQVRDVVETKDGTVARVVMRDERPLTADEDAAEHERLQEMLNSPDAFHRHIEKDRTGKKLAVDLLKLLPDAMIFSYTPGQPQRGDKPAGGAPELVVDFKPNPQWNPPSMASEALTGLEGRAWIDARTHYLTRLEARLFQGVNFGYGIFAHLYPGGTFVLEQVPVDEGRWIVEHFVEHVTVRELMVRTVKENTDLVASEFSVIPGMPYQDAIRMLLSTPLPGSPGGK
jgi:hypothetical protein